MVDLSSYEKARPWARAMREAMLEGHGYSAGNGGALTPFERELLVQWIDGGAPERPKLNPADFSPGPGRDKSAEFNFGFARIAAPDPLAALDAHHAARGGRREIIPGLGLALRTPDEILIFERGPGPGERIIARGTFVPSLAAHLAALPADTPRTRISDAAYVIGPSAEPRYEVAELAPAGPDRFWCAMHPDVRSSAPGMCQRCGMALVEMPQLSLDDFALQIADAKVANFGVTFSLRVSRDGSSEPVTQFLTTHERPFHLFIVDEDLKSFAHVHPVPGRTTLTASLELPAPGRYRLIGEFAPLDAMPQVRMTDFQFHGPAGRIAEAPSTLTGVLTDPGAKAGKESRLSFQLRDARTGRRPEDLEPYLGAAAHLFVIDEQVRDPLHAHPVEIEGAGLARPAFDVRFPRAGRYVMWLQVQRAGKVETLRFTAGVSK